MRAWIVVGLAAIVGGGCKKESAPREGSGAAVTAQAPASGSAAAPGPATALDAGVDAADAADAGADAADAADAGADAAVAAPWPASVTAATSSERRQLSRTLAAELSLPRVRTRPPALGDELNARFARYKKLDIAAADYTGSYSVSCEVVLASRFAVIVECGELRDYLTLAESRAGTGGAPAGPDPDLTAVWMQPGLPAIELGQLAPGIDAAAVIAKAVKSAPSDCHLDWCEYRPDSFWIDAEGILFRPITYCSASCSEEHLPRIPLDALKPTHPWGVQLVEWIRKRVDAGQPLGEPTAP